MVKKRWLEAKRHESSHLLPRAICVTHFAFKCGLISWLKKLNHFSPIQYSPRYTCSSQEFSSSSFSATKTASRYSFRRKKIINKSKRHRRPFDKWLNYIESSLTSRSIQEVVIPWEKFNKVQGKHMWWSVSGTLSTSVIYEIMIDYSTCFYQV